MLLILHINYNNVASILYFPPFLFQNYLHKNGPDIFGRTIRKQSGTQGGLSRQSRADCLNSACLNRTQIRRLHGQVRGIVTKGSQYCWRAHARHGYTLLADVLGKNLCTLSLSRIEVRDRGTAVRLEKNGELGSFIGRISRLTRGRCTADRPRWLARGCTPDGSQMYPHTLSTFLHPLK